MKAISLNPDHEQTLINLAVWHHNKGNTNNAKKCLQHLLNKYPNNEQAKAMLAELR
jgi:TolA-binding protein